MMWKNWKVRTDLAKLSWLRPCTGSGWNLLGTTLRPAMPRFWCVQYSFLKKGSCALAILCIVCQWNSASCNIPPSHQVSIFLVSLSFFLDKDQNLLFKYIVIALSCNVVYIAVYFAWSRKKEFTQMWAYLQNVKPLLEDRKIKLTFRSQQTQNSCRIEIFI